MNMPVATSAFAVVKGEPAGWHRVSPSGANTTSWFCGHCACRIHGTRPSRPGSVVVRAGTLDDTSWLVPAAHLYTGTAQPWVRLPAADCYDGLPPDFVVLEKAWQAGIEARGD
jgi:hypothetical protein